MTAGLLLSLLLAANGAQPPPRPAEGLIAARIVSIGTPVPGVRLPVLVGVRNVSGARIVLGVRRSQPAPAWSTQLSFSPSEPSPAADTVVQPREEVPCTAPGEDAIALEPGQEVLRGDEVNVPASMKIGRSRLRADVTISGIDESLGCLKGAFTARATLDVHVQSNARGAPTALRPGPRRIAVRVVPLRSASSADRLAVLVGVRNRSSRLLLFPVPGANSVNHHWLESYSLTPLSPKDAGGVHGGLAVSSLHTPKEQACVGWLDYLGLQRGAEVLLGARIQRRDLPLKARAMLTVDVQLLDLPPQPDCVQYRERFVIGTGHARVTLR